MKQPDFTQRSWPSDAMSPESRQNVCVHCGANFFSHPRRELCRVCDVPKVALSIRQPWAWLIANGYKDYENRTWGTYFRGPFYIHAAKGMTKLEYCRAMNFMAVRRLGVAKIPAFEELERGGIVGRAEIVASVTSAPSPWFTGPFAFEIRNPTTLPFFPCKGALSFFRAYHPADIQTTNTGARTHEDNTNPSNQCAGESLL